MYIAFPFSHGYTKTIHQSPDVYARPGQARPYLLTGGHLSPSHALFSPESWFCNHPQFPFRVNALVWKNPSPSSSRPTNGMAGKQMPIFKPASPCALLALPAAALSHPALGPDRVREGN